MTRIGDRLVKKTLGRKKKGEESEAMRSEYRLDYSKSKPNRFAAKMSEGTLTDADLTGANLEQITFEGVKMDQRVEEQIREFHAKHVRS